MAVCRPLQLAPRSRSPLSRARCFSPESRRCPESRPGNSRPLRPLWWGRESVSRWRNWLLAKKAEGRGFHIKWNFWNFNNYLHCDSQPVSLVVPEFKKLWNPKIAFIDSLKKPNLGNLRLSMKNRRILMFLLFFQICKIFENFEISLKFRVWSEDFQVKFRKKFRD